MSTVTLAFGAVLFYAADGLFEGFSVSPLITTLLVVFFAVFAVVWALYAFNKLQLSVSAADGGDGADVDDGEGEWTGEAPEGSAYCQHCDTIFPSAELNADGECGGCSDRIAATRAAGDGL